ALCELFHTRICLRPLASGLPTAPTRQSRFRPSLRTREWTMPAGASSPRLAVVSDIHGNIRALEAVLADIKTRGADAIVNLGDSVTSPLWPRETYDLLASLALPTVRGNHDRAMIGSFDGLTPAAKFAHAALTQQQREALARLPTRVEVAPGILAVHGTPDHDSTLLL